MTLVRINLPLFSTVVPAIIIAVCSHAFTLFWSRNTSVIFEKIAGTTVENKGKLILTEIFPSVQKHDIFLVLIFWPVHCVRLLIWISVCSSFASLYTFLLSNLSYKGSTRIVDHLVSIKSFQNSLQKFFFIFTRSSSTIRLRPLSLFLPPGNHLPHDIKLNFTVCYQYF